MQLVCRTHALLGVAASGCQTGYIRVVDVRHLSERVAFDVAHDAILLGKLGLDWSHFEVDWLVLLFGSERRTEFCWVGTKSREGVVGELRKDVINRIEGEILVEMFIWIFWFWRCDSGEKSGYMDRGVVWDRASSRRTRFIGI